MPSECTWIIQDHVIHHKIWGRFTRDEVHEADVTLQDMFESSNANKIHLIINDEGIEEMPPITALRALTIATNPKLGWALIYGNKNKGLRFTTNIATKMLGFHFMLVQSYDQAMEKLYEVDPKLPPLNSTESVK